MSLDTLPRASGDFDDWDELRDLAVLEDAYARPAMEPERPRREHRPARPNDRRAAIERSKRGEA